MFSRWGKVAAASATATLIHEFDINHLIFTGVAASINSNVKVGDIVIAESLYQHDMDARPLFSKYEIPLTKKRFFKTDVELFQVSTAAARQYLIGITRKNNDSAQILQKFKEFNIHSPVVHTGIIATGDKFMRSQEQIEDILNELHGEAKNVLAVEMEGAAVAQVCAEHCIPYCIIRTISDCADCNASIDFADFISSIAKHYSYEVIKGIFSAEWLGLATQ